MRLRQAVTAVQFSVIGALSGGLTVPVSFAVTGGTISSSGLYAAGPTAGTYLLIATAVGGRLADTTVITVTDASPLTRPDTGALLLDEDFSRYTSDEHWRSNPFRWQIVAPAWFNQGAIHLDPGNGYGGSKQSLRYDWPAAPNGDASRWCSKDITREAGYKLPQVPEVWIEVVHKFAPTFNTNHKGNPGGRCGVGGYKFVLIWREGTGDRLDLLNGVNGHEWWSAHPAAASEPRQQGKCSGIGFNCRLGWGTAQDIYRANVPGRLWDGQWHVYRFHVKLPNVQGENTGIYEVWIDGKLVKRVTGQDFMRRTGGWSNRLAFVALGSNSNSGTSQSTHNWWGRLRVWTSNPGW